MSLEELIKLKSSKLDFPTNFSAEEIGDGELLSADDLYIRRGYSPLEWEVRRRLKPMVEKKLGREPGSFGKMMSGDSGKLLWLHGLP